MQITHIAQKSEDGKTFYWYSESTYAQGNETNYIHYVLLIG